MKTHDTHLSEARVPKYLKLAQHLRQQVQTGALRPGERLPSFADMKAQHGISQATMEKMHALLEQEGLIVREQGRGTFVAPTPGRVHTGVLGCLSAGFTQTSLTPYFAHLLRGIQQGAARAGRQIMLLDHTALTPGWEKVDGILMAEQQSPLIESQLPPGMPVVSMLMPNRNATSIVADDYNGFKLAVQHVLALGHRRIACLLDNGPLARRRLQGFRDAMREAGIDHPAEWEIFLDDPKVTTDLSTWFVAGARESVQKWLREHGETQRCTALLTQNDHAGIGALQALQEAGIKVPEAMSVTGFDGTEQGEFCSPPLTSIKVPLTEIGATALQHLLKQIESNSITPEPHEITLPVSLLVRSSTAWCASTAPPREP